MSAALTRRGLVAAVPVAALAASLPAIAACAEPDAELLALRPAWLEARRVLETTFDPLAKAEQLTKARMKADSFLEEAAVAQETGLAQAEADQGRAYEAEWDLVARAFDIPAKTRDGIRFKLEIIRAYKDCEFPWMAPTLRSDLLAMVGIYDA